MNHEFDEMKLSAYLDGELDSADMFQLEETIDNNEGAQQYVLDAVKSSARLRAEMNSVLQEEIPERLLNTIDHSKRKKTRLDLGIPHLMRIAAVFILVVMGFTAGRVVDRQVPNTAPPLMDYFPAKFSQVVDDTLENYLSGTSKEWRSPGDTLAVKVTPVKTYRDGKGVYYREYRMEVAVKDELRRFNGLAYRTSYGQWKTRALFFDTNGNSI